MNSISKNTLQALPVAAIKSRAQPFTLIEIVVAIAIISIVAGVLGINIASAIRQQKFESATTVVVDKLRLAQDLMLMTSGDYQVVIEPVEDKFKLKIESDGVLANTHLLNMVGKELLIEGIEEIRFEEDGGPSTVGVSEIRIQFMSGGSVMSKGLLSLSSGSYKRYICLTGYPKSIVSNSEKEQICSEEDLLYDERITRNTLELVNEKN